MNKIFLKEIALEQYNAVKELKIKNEIRREKLEEVEKFLKLPHSIIISGVRRCGKSTLIRQIMRKYFNDDCYYFNFEDERLIDFEASDFNSLYEVLLELFGEKKVFFFDEIQNVEGWERFVRRMQDNGFKFIITGSNAALLSRELGTKLTGRQISFTLYPFSFSEFLVFKNYKFNKNDFLLTKKRAAIKKFFRDYLENGGMPEFLLNKTPEVLKSVYDDILYKDVAARYRIGEVKTLRELALYLTVNLSDLFSYNNLKNIFNLGSVSTVKSYIGYLENSFLFFTVNLFSYSLKKQIVNPKKIFVIDNGIANKIAYRFSKDRGKFLENTVFLELKRRLRDVYYYKTEKGKEVDFLAIKSGKKELIQVSQSIKNGKTRKREIDGLIEAMDELKLKNGLILTEDEEEIIKAGKKKIVVKPAYKWLLMNSD